VTAPRPEPVKVMAPASLRRRGAGALYGYWHPTSAAANILACGAPPARPRSAPPVQLLGWIGPRPAGRPAGEPGLSGTRDEQGRLEFALGNREVAVDYYQLHQDLFSRNTGILESERMASRRAILVGCGSVGSLAALELARAGVGGFLLVDQDRLHYHNLCRHQCGISDVGRYKGEALADRIREINPEAVVAVENRVIQRVPKEVFDRWAGAKSIFLGSGDNREADLYANRVACLYRVPLVSVGLWERAFADEVFYTIPGEMPCYKCYCETIGFTEAVINQNRRFYTTREDLAEVNFEPGISTDLSFVTLVAVKLVYDLLTRREEGVHSKVLHDLAQLTLVCNSTDPAVGGEMSYLFSHALQVTRSLVVERLEGCPHCRIVGKALGE